MTNIMVVKLRDYDLDEDSTVILFDRNGKRYDGPLFFGLIGNNRICKTYKSITVDESNDRDEVLQVIKNYLDLCDEFNLKKYETTMTTMMHWSFMNGFSNAFFRTWDDDEIKECATLIGHPEQKRLVDRTFFSKE